MQKQSYYIINGITFYRLIAAPCLFLLIFFDEPGIFRWLLGISFFTDAIDGSLARRYNVVSVFGSRLDSVADDLTVAAGITGAIILKPAFVQEQLFVLLLLLGLFVAQIAMALFKYGKPTSFHTYLAKIAALFQGVFLLLLFFLPNPNYVLFYLMVTVTILDVVEELALVLLLPDWQSDVKSIWPVLNKRRKKPAQQELR